MITYVGHFIGHRAFAFIIVGTRRIPATTTSKFSSLYSHYTLVLIIHTSFNAHQTNHHRHYPSQQVHLLSSWVPSTLWTQNEEGRLFLIIL